MPPPRQQVAFSNAATLLSREGARTYIPHVDPVEATTQQGGEPACREVQQDTSGARRAVITRAEHRGGMDHDRRKSVRDRAAYTRLTLGLRSVVDRVLRSNPRCRLVDDRRAAGEVERVDAAAVHVALHAGVERCPCGVLGTSDVRVADPAAEVTNQRDHRGEMEHRFGPVERRPQGCRVAHVRLDDLDLQPLECPPRRVDHRAHRASPGQQLTNEDAADESTGSGHHRRHRRALPCASRAHRTRIHCLSAL